MKYIEKFEKLTMKKINDIIYLVERRPLALSWDFLRNSYLGAIADIFNDGSSWTECVKRYLLDPQSRGICNEHILLRFEGNLVTIEPRLVDNPEELTIEIDRRVLLDLINQWQELVKQGYEHITFTREHDGTITLTGNGPTAS